MLFLDVIRNDETNEVDLTSTSVKYWPTAYNKWHIVLEVTLIVPNIDGCLKQGTYYVKDCHTFFKIITTFCKITGYVSVYKW